MTVHPRFYRVAGICSLASAITTLLLIYLPDFYPPVDGFEQRMALVQAPAYRWRSWVYLIHPFLVLTAALGVALRIGPRAPVLALIGTLGFMLWAFTEAFQQTFTLFAFDKWRLEYLSGDADAQAAMLVKTQIFDGVWDALYFLLLIGFAIGNLSFGAVLMADRGFARIVGAFLIAGSALTLTYLLGELRVSVLPAPLASWTYPMIQPLGRALLGVWLWLAATRDGNLVQAGPSSS